MKHLVLSLLFLSPAFAQGPQTPPAAPGPTQRSLQEIWDALAAQRSVIETNRSNLATTTSLQDSISTSLGDLAATGLTDDTAGFDFFTIAEGTGIGRECVLTILTSGEIVAAFLDEAQNDLKITRNGTGSWVTETIDFNASGPLTITENENGHPSVLFFNPDAIESYASTFNGTSWQQSQVSDNALPVHSDYAIAADGRRYAVRIVLDTVLYFAEATGNLWEEEVLSLGQWAIGLDDFGSDNYISGVSLAVQSNGEPIVSVFRKSRTSLLGTVSETILLLRRAPNNTWTISEVDSTTSFLAPSGVERNKIRSGTFLRSAGGVVKLSYQTEAVGQALEATITGIDGGSFTFPTGGYERIVYEHVWDVSTEPIELLSVGNPKDFASHPYYFVDRSPSPLDLAFHYTFLEYSNDPLIEASDWNDQPVEVCGFARPDGRIAVAIRRPYQNDFIIAVEKP